MSQLPEAVASQLLPLGEVGVVGSLSPDSGVRGVIRETSSGQALGSVGPLDSGMQIVEVAELLVGALLSHCHLQSK